MVGFIGRTMELERLEEVYNEEESGACAIYGRRRVGKTTLMQRFCEDKPHFITQIAGDTESKTMDILTKDLREFMKDDVKDLEDPYDLIKALSRIKSDKKVVVFIDEFPLLVDLFPETPGIFQRFIDHEMKQMNIMLVICGSSIKSMMDQLEDSSKPLFGRFHPRMRINPMPYREARQFHPDMDEVDRIRMYAICSGMPMYHKRMYRKTVEENIIKSFIGDGEFIDEADNALSKELSQWRACKSIISAIASRNTTESQISGDAGLSVPTCTNHLESLKLMGIVECFIPWGQKNPRSYRIVDGMQLFNQHVLKGREVISGSRNRDLAYKALLPAIETFYGRRFEDICKEFLKDTEAVERIGTWTGKIPKKENGTIVRDENGKVKTEDVDVDIVADIREGNTVITAFAECKFTSWKCGRAEIDELIQRSVYVSKDKNRRYYLFSRSGFTVEAMEQASYGVHDIRLIDMDRIREWAESTEPGSV